MTDVNRRELIEAFASSWDAKDVDGLMELMADDCVFRSSTGPEPGSTYSGRSEVRRAFERFLAPTDPVPQPLPGDILVHDDFAVTRWGHRLPQPDGPDLEVRGCDVFEFDGDRISVKDTYRKVGPPRDG